MENIDGGPGHLLLGLPSIAWQCLIETLLDIDCAGLAQLLRCSKLTRQLVLQHAPAITYCPRDGQNDDEVHQVATRRTDLALTLDFGALESRQRAEELLQRAALSKGPQGCSGWSAVTRLNILGFQDTALPVESADTWHSLVGPACPRLNALDLDHVRVSANLLSSLVSATKLRLLTLLDHCDIHSSLTDNLDLMPRWLPSLSHLSLRATSDQCKLLTCVASQLTKLVVEPLQKPPHIPGPQHLQLLKLCLPACTNLTDVHLPRHGLDNDAMEALLGLEHLRHVSVVHTRSLTRSFATRPCKWETLSLYGGTSVTCIPLLPLSSIKMVKVVSLEVLISEDAAAVRSQVQAAAETLAGLAREGRAQWWDDRLVVLRLRHKPADAPADDPAADDLLTPRQLSEASVHAALSSWAPMQPYVDTVELDWFEMARMRPVEVLVNERYLKGSDLRALSASFSPTLADLVIHGAPLSTDAWRALQTDALPKLSTLHLVDTVSLSAADLTGFCMSTQRPLTVQVYSPMYTAARAVGQTLRALSGLGLLPSVKLQVSGWHDAAGVFQEDEGDELVNWVAPDFAGAGEGV